MDDLSMPRSQRPYLVMRHTFTGLIFSNNTHNSY